MRRYLLILTFLGVVCSINAQQPDSTDVQTSIAQRVEEKRFDLTIMPFMSYNRNLEFMIGVIPMVMYRLDKNDTSAPKSISGLSAVYTTNNSYFIAFFNRFFFKEDAWRGKFFFFNGDYNSQFFMDDGEEISGFYDYGTKVTNVSIGVQRRIIDKLYGGLTYSFAHYDTVYEDDVQPPSELETNAIEINALLDSRSSVYYPMGGEKVSLRFISFPEWFGNDDEAKKVLMEYNKYIPMKNGKDVIAARFSGKFGLGDISFQQQQTIGYKDIRGYSQGEFRGDGIMAVQGEYRYNFANKMGLVGFAGMATLYGSDTESFNWDVYPGAGIGYRYQAFKNVKFNIGLDAAVGKSDWGIYFRIGEAF